MQVRVALHVTQIIQTHMLFHQLMQAGLYDRFVEAVTENTRELRLGNGMDATVNMGPLITEERVNRVRSCLCSSKVLAEFSSMEDGVIAKLNVRKMDWAGSFNASDLTFWCHSHTTYRALSWCMPNGAVACSSEDGGWWYVWLFGASLG